MNSLRFYIREAILSERVEIDPFALKSTITTKTYDPYEKQTDLVKGAFSGAGTLLKAGRLLVTSSKKGGGLGSAAAKVKGNWRQAGWASIVIGGLIGGVDDLSTAKKEVVDKADKDLNDFHAAILRAIDQHRGQVDKGPGLIYDIRCPSLREENPPASAIQKIDEFEQHYDKVSNSISTSKNYESFFTNMGVYGASYGSLKSEINGIIRDFIPGSLADAKKKKEREESLKTWAHAVLIMDTVHESLSPALTEDLVAYEKTKEYTDAESESKYTNKMADRAESVVQQTARDMKASDTYQKAAELLSASGYLEEGE